ncbi:uncharacterized protein LOC127848732 [Dreissena polymorpha]|uniref:Uncharacterized protein n=1 Tax=Dreissena polymorpha TaxID=45954 RepID=A0A9D4I6T0_DREPO|nr:uncharacterized protein LOC127848732 [Dreissena polymorpha]XP_052237300.1 uncharacterized protein LOC127848732 [Dreissena polymorpha]KAH3750309.1 hypothetical protein DPMN_184829 [Dreissena polymorpha]
MATFSSFDDDKIVMNGATVSKTVTKNDTERNTDSEKVGYTCCMSRLHPGTEVVCEKSGTPDANFNDLVKTNQEPRKWVIDTVKDRFLKVVQEQEMVQVNILDPNSQDDEYRHLVQALQEYTQTINEVAQCMYDVIREVGLPSLDDQMMVQMGREGVEIEAMRATNKLIRIHKALLESSHSALQIAEEDGAASRALRKSGRRRVRCFPSGIEDDSDTRAIIETTREHSETLGNIVLTLITELINKYRLPSNLMARLEERIVQQHEEDMAEKVNQMRKLKKIKQKEAGNVVRNKKARKKDKRAIYKQLAKEEAKKNESGNQSEAKVSQVSIQGSGGTDLVEVIGEKQNGYGATAIPVDEAKAKEDETNDDWGNDRAFKEKFCAVLQEKFSYKFSHTEAELENTERETKKESDATSEEKEKKELCLESALVRMNASCAKRSSRNWKKTALFQQTNEMFMVNFYTLSTAFINELHSMKHEALEQRKDQTMKDLHNRLQKMKDEMARVEDEVAAELAAELKLRTRLILEGNSDI